MFWSGRHQQRGESQGFNGRIASGFKAMADFVFGYDFFISYAWLDGREFAVSLYRQLTDRGYDCFLDSTEYASGDNWDLVGERAIRKTSNLVLVGTAGALKSQPVLREVQRFVRNNRRIIPISFDGSLNSDSTSPDGVLGLIQAEILRIATSRQELSDGASAATVDRICRSFQTVRQSKKRQRLITLVAVVTTILAVLAGWEWRIAVRQTARAVANLEVAKGQRSAALDVFKESIHEVQENLESVPNAEAVQIRLANILRNGLKNMASQRLPNGELDEFNAGSQIEIAVIMASLRDTEHEKPFELAQRMLGEADGTLSQLIVANPGNTQALRDLSWASNEQGRLAMETGDRAKALNLFERSHQLMERAIRQQSNDSQLQYDLLWSELRLGEYYEELGEGQDGAAGSASDESGRINLHQALRFFQQALKIGEKLVAARFPKGQSVRGKCLDRLCDVCLSLHRRGESEQLGAAAQYAEHGLQLRRRLVQETPNDKRTQRELNISLDKMGTLAIAQQDFPAALKWRQEGLEASETMLKFDPHDANLQRDVAISYRDLATALIRLDYEAEFLENQRIYTSKIQSLADAAPEDAELQEDLMVAHRTWGEYELAMQRPAAARPHFQAGLDVLQRFNAFARKPVFDQQVRRLQEKIAKCQ